MTGLYPSRHGVYNNVATATAIHSGLNEGVTTFSEGLRAAGYNLGYSGKYHISAHENPSDRGWDDLLVYAGKRSVSPRTRIEHFRQLSQPERSPESRRPGEILRPGWGDVTIYETLPDGGPEGYEDSSDWTVVRKGIEGLRNYAAQDKPWCVFFGPNGPHDAFRVPKKFVDSYDLADIPLPPNYGDHMADKPHIYQRMRRQYWDQLTPDEVRDAVRHYWAYCTMEDVLFGEVLKALDETGQADDTFVIRISDHGEYCGAHGLFCKGVPAFREAYHIPAIVRWPHGIENPGRTVEDFVTLADFAPTLLELAGAEAPEPVSGRSLVPFLEGRQPTDWRDDVCSQFNGVELYYTQRSVTTREHKYVYNGFDFDELYDLRSDPHEMVNLSEHPDYQDVKRDLVRRMWRFAAREDDHVFNPYYTVAMAPWGPADALSGT
jgi:arylsulfatase A-like enzyme